MSMLPALADASTIQVSAKGEWCAGDPDMRFWVVKKDGTKAPISSAQGVDSSGFRMYEVSGVDLTDVIQIGVQYVSDFTLGCDRNLLIDYMMIDTTETDCTIPNDGTICANDGGMVVYNIAQDDDDDSAFDVCTVANACWYFEDLARFWVPLGTGYTIRMVDNGALIFGLPGVIFQCSNGKDDDSDGQCDFFGCSGMPGDTDCSSFFDNSEAGGGPGASCTIEWHGRTLLDSFPTIVDPDTSVDISAKHVAGPFVSPITFWLDDVDLIPTTVGTGVAVATMTTSSCMVAGGCPHRISLTESGRPCRTASGETYANFRINGPGVSAVIQINGSDGPLTVRQGDSVSYTWSASGFPGAVIDPPACTLSLGATVVDSVSGGSGGGDMTSHVAAASLGTHTVTFTCTNASGAANDSLALTITAAAPPPPVCGNGTIEPPEECDDGNFISGDGCSGLPLLVPLLVGCTIEPGFICTGVPSSCVPPGGGGPPPPVLTGGLVPCGRSQDDLTTTGINEKDPCNFCHFFVLFERIVNFLLIQLMPVIIVLLVSWGGFLIMTARDNPGQVRNGREIITWALLGYALMLMAWLIVNTFFTVLGIASWAGVGEWWKITCSL